MSGALVVVAAFLVACVLVQWAILVKLSEEAHPGVVATVTVIVSALVTTTALSGALLTLIRQAGA